MECSKKWSVQLPPSRLNKDGLQELQRCLQELGSAGLLFLGLSLRPVFSSVSCFPQAVLQVFSRWAVPSCYCFQSSLAVPDLFYYSM